MHEHTYKKVFPKLIEIMLSCFVCIQFNLIINKLALNTYVLVHLSSLETNRTHSIPGVLMHLSIYPYYFANGSAGKTRNWNLFAELAMRMCLSYKVQT